MENVGKRERERKRPRRVEEMREKERRERIRTAAGRKGVARNILASPRAPSCVLNHFPVDSAVCSPIIGVSPPGKLLFYSRTTRAPDVPGVPRYSSSLSLSFSLLLLSAGFFSPVFLRPSRSFSRPHQSLDLSRTFSPSTTFSSATRPILCAGSSISLY